MNKQYEAAIISDLEWGDIKKVIINEEENESNLDVAEEENVKVNEDDGTTATDSHIVTRNCRPPIWIRNYETGEGFSEEKNEARLAIFTVTHPISFKEVVKSKKWRMVMNVEMEAIEKNGSWELTSLS